GLLELGHHLGVIMVGRVGRRKGLEEIRRHLEVCELQAQTLQGPGFGFRGFDEHIVAADLEDVRAGAGDGRTGLDVEDVRDFIGADPLRRLCGGRSCQDEPEQQRERQPLTEQTMAETWISHRIHPPWLKKNAAGRAQQRRSPGRTSRHSLPHEELPCSARQLGLCALGTLKVAWQTPIWAWLQAALAFPVTPLHRCCLRVEMQSPTVSKGGLTLMLTVTLPQRTETGPVGSFVRKTMASGPLPQTAATPSAETFGSQLVVVPSVQMYPFPKSGQAGSRTRLEKSSRYSVGNPPRRLSAVGPGIRPSEKPAPMLRVVPPSTVTAIAPTIPAVSLWSCTPPAVKAGRSSVTPTP